MATGLAACFRFLNYSLEENGRSRFVFNIPRHLNQAILIAVLSVCLVPLPFVAASTHALQAQVSNANCSLRGSGDGLYTISGQVVNNGFTPAIEVRVIGTLYDDANQVLVNATSGLTSPPNIPPGGSAAFVLVLDSPSCASISSYRVEAINATEAG